jgi:hypothetical protein
LHRYRHGRAFDHSFLRHGRPLEPAIQAVVKSGSALVFALPLDGRVECPAMTN